VFLGRTLHVATGTLSWVRYEARVTGPSSNSVVAQGLRCPEPAGTGTGTGTGKQVKGEQGQGGVRSPLPHPPTCPFPSHKQSNGAE